MQNMMPKHQYSMLENIIFLLTLSYKEQKRLNRGMAWVLLVYINHVLAIFNIGPIVLNIYTSIVL